jgi:hypothetical protein
VNEEQDQKTDDTSDQGAAPVDGTSVPPLQDEGTVTETVVERTEVTPAEPSTPAHEENERIHEEQADNRTVVEETSTTTTTESSSDGE